MTTAPCNGNAAKGEEEEEEEEEEEPGLSRSPGGGARAGGWALDPCSVARYAGC
jgi:hypothetical protein